MIATISTQTQVQSTSQKLKKRVGIFGGTFNPPHIGQLILAESVGKQLGLEKVYWMPNAIPVDATHTNAIEPSYRAQMVRLAIMDNPLFDIDLTEIRNGGESHTFFTMQELIKQHPENEYYFIMGAEKMKFLPQWDHIEELSQLVTFVAGLRAGEKRESAYPALWFDVPDVHISASDIRTRIRLNQSINYLVPDREVAFIEEYHLYRGLYE